MMMIDIYISLQKLPKIDLKTLKIAISCYFCLVACLLLPWQLCVLIYKVFLLLSHNIQDVLFKNDDERYPYQSLKFAKN